MGRVVVSGVDTASAEVAGTVSRSLSADLTAVRQARDVVQRVLESWRADEIFDDVVLVASELVANALRHGMQVDQPVDQAGINRQQNPATESGRVGPAGRDGRGSPAGVRISLVSTGSHVICAVTDPSATPPVRRSADPFAGSGRGLMLVESLSLCWGWTLLDDPDPDPEATPAVHGKSVWAIFPLDLRRQAGAA